MDTPHLELYRHRYSRFVEASMHSPFGGSRGKEDGFFDKWGFGILVLPVLLAVAMVVQHAEFPGNSASPSEAPTHRQ